MELTEFLLARIAEDEAVAREAIAERTRIRPDWGPDRAVDVGDWPAVVGVGGERFLDECEAKRRIVALHQEWPVLIQTEPTIERVEPDPADLTAMSFRAVQQIVWATNREYVARFGTEPPTTPILTALALPYRDHPDFDPAWEA